MTFQGPNNYPKTEEMTIRARQVTFASMKDAVKKANAKLKRNLWTNYEAKSFLLIHGLNNPLISKIIQENNYKTIQELLLPVWKTGRDVNTHIEIIMHLCFLGITETVGMILRNVLTDEKKWTMFHNNQELLTTIRGMQLDWCKCWNFGSEGKSFRPWVSENVLAYARIFKSVYSYLNIIIQESSKV